MRLHYLQWADWERTPGRDNGVEQHPHESRLGMRSYNTAETRAE